MLSAIFFHFLFTPSSCSIPLASSAILAPCFANFHAVALPMPPDAPAHDNTLSLNHFLT